MKRQAFRSPPSTLELPVPIEVIERRISLIRGQKVMFGRPDEYSDHSGFREAP
jgi:hypothetical protein